MAKKFIIDIFKPPDFEKAELDINYLNNITGKNFIYASMGRWAFYHILVSLNVRRILLPVYICDTILIPVKELRIEPLFYDIEESDLNGSLESIIFFTNKYKVDSVLGASLYGNPANLKEIEKFCLQKGLKLIDDAAQSFGAKIDERYVGTFGNGGFFSISPGKALAGHLGAFFWTENEEYKFPRTENFFYHYLAYLDFYYNRLKIYQYKKFHFFRLISILKKAFGKLVNITNDDIQKFEEKYLGGILNAALQEKFQFRQKYFAEFVKRFGNNDCFRIISPVRGKAVNHKIVLLFKKQDFAISFQKFMRRHRIYCGDGYPLLTWDFAYLPNAQKIQGKVKELPIENDPEKMNYLFEMVDSYLKWKL